MGAGGRGGQGFHTGKLKFKLYGEKLQGSWAVRMGGKSGDDGKNWLLIKHRDEEAKPAAKFDVLKRQPLSVVTGRDLDEIASDADAVWTSKGKVSGKSAKKAIASAVKKTAKPKMAKRTVKKNERPSRPSRKASSLN